MTGSEAEAPRQPVADTPWRRLHPASLAVNLLPQAWRTARGAWPLLLAIFVGGDDLGLRAVDLTLLLTFMGLTLARTLTHYLTLRYRLHDRRLELRSGLLHRQARIIAPKRIQNIELVRNPLHRLSGLVELRIETAGDASTEGLLSALDVAEAERLRAALRSEPGPLAPAAGDVPTAEPAASAPEEPVWLGNSPVELFAYGLTRRTMGTAAVLSALFYQSMNVSSPDEAEQVARSLGPAAMAGAVLLAFVGSFVLSVGQVLLKHFRFRLLLPPERLVTEEGLFTRRRVEIPLRKVQLVRADEPLLRRVMGYGTVQIETAGMGISEGQLRQAEAELPMVEQDRLAELARRAIPHLDVDPWATRLSPPHPRALWRASVRRALSGLVLGGVVGALAWPWGAAALLVIPPLGVLVAWLDWRRQGWTVTPTVIVARRGFFNRQTWIVARDKVQSVQLGQSPMMRWHGLCAVVIRAAGSDVALPELGLDQAQEVLEALVPRD